MSKKVKVIILLVLALVAAGILSRPLWQKESPVAANNLTGTGVPVEQSINHKMAEALKTGKPVGLVLTYNADCCENTRAFFDEEKAKVSDLEKKYKDRINFVWINVAVQDQKELNDIKKVSSRYEVTTVPALVLLDSKGQLVDKYVGVLDQQKAEQVISGMVGQ